MDDNKRKCSCCGITFDVRREGIVGQINGKPVQFCSECCRRDS